MPIFINIAILLLGLILLIFSSDLLIKTSVKLAFLLKLSTLFVGLIFVAFGTSCPEATVSIVAIIKKYKDIALGNIIGSNIANIGLVLGLSCLIRPLKVDSSLFKREIPLMFICCILLFILCLDGQISRLEGMILVFLFVFFCIFSYKSSKSHKESQDFELKGFLERTKSKFLIISLFITSLILLVLSSNFLVNSGVNLAKYFGISNWIIAMTVFAIGTSLPELGASITASIKKVSSISIGNVIGSNIFNILFVLGLVSLMRPINVNLAILTFELPILLFFSLILLIVTRIKYRISRWEGLILFTGYIVFIILLITK